MSKKGAERRLRDVTFDEKLGSSRFVRAIRMHFRRDETTQSLFWDLALEHDNVAVLLYHSVRQCFVLVKQFRPRLFFSRFRLAGMGAVAVFVQRIRQRPENVGKPLSAIDWSNYPVSMGETVELCSGMMDKAEKSPLETVHEEINEECGYYVDPFKIEKIKIYLTGVGISGSSQHLFYAEVNDAMKVNEGGGIAAEGEFIEKVFLSFDEARQLLDAETSTDTPPSLLFALSWFFRNKAAGRPVPCDGTPTPIYEIRMNSV